MIEKIIEKNAHKYSAANYLLYLLSKRDYSEKEVWTKLKSKEYDSEEIELAIEKAKEHKWLSDERFCGAFLRYRAQQGIGPRRLKQELKMKGIADYLITQALEEAEYEEIIDFFALAERVFEKKRPKIWDIKAKQKMYRFMISRGFYQDHFSHLMEMDYNDEEDFYE